MKRAVSFLVVCAVVVLALGVRPASAIINSWRKILPDVATYAVAVAASPIAGEPGIIFAGTAYGIRKSSDNGATWSLVSYARALSLAADPLTPGVIYAATAGGLLKSADYGQTWLGLTAAVRSFVAVSPFDPKVLYGGNLKSVDGGATWYPMAGLPPVAGSTATSEMFHLACSKDPAQPGFMLAAVGERSYRSDNRGESWSLFKSDVDSVAIDPVDARYFYLGGRCGRGVTRYFPGGSSNSGSFSHVHGVTVDPANRERLFAAGDIGATATSRNLGLGWQSGAALSASVPEGRMIFDASSGQVLLPTSRGLFAKSSWCGDADNDGYSSDGGLCGGVDCNESSAAVNPGARESCLDLIDNNCNGAADMADGFCIQLCSDADGDGHLAFGCVGGDDCWDQQPTVYPGAPEVCDGMDNDCNGGWDESFDLDADGETVCGGDCNDNDPAIFSWATEIPHDGIDQNCDERDLTIAFHRVKYQRTHDYLLLEVASQYGEEAGLWADYYGPLSWDANRNLWVGVFADIAAKPSFVTVSGPEGRMDFGLSLFQLKWQHELGTLKVEVDSPYGADDSVLIANFGSLAWVPNKQIWYGEFPGVTEKPFSLEICGYDGCMVTYLK